ncbi:hypothetical protein PM082_018130 [Marasmius tenuissimus]|nr:hypothetical protein PM082_018130 [Marasmius tenuissimus]
MLGLMITAWGYLTGQRTKKRSRPRESRSRSAKSHVLPISNRRIGFAEIKANAAGQQEDDSCRADTTNAQEAMHFSMYSHFGKEHELMDGLTFCKKYADMRERQYTTRLVGTKLWDGKPALTERREKQESIMRTKNTRTPIAIRDQKKRVRAAQTDYRPPESPPSSELIATESDQSGDSEATESLVGSDNDFNDSDNDGETNAKVQSGKSPVGCVITDFCVSEYLFLLNRLFFGINRR